MPSDSPLLVIGAGRGGTSLLAACLDGHPKITMRSEFMSTEVLIGDNFPVSSISRLAEERLARFRALCDEDRARHPGKIWGNKLTTEQFAGLEVHNALNGVCVNMIERFLSTMESYRVIFVIRHGASCIESKVRRTGQPLVRATLGWCYSVRLLEGMRELGGLKAVCRYEDLVAEPKKTLSNLCDTLGLSFHEGMLAQTGCALLPEEYRYGCFLSEKSEKHPTLPPEILTMIAPSLERLGYTTP
jgi:Sulfotransferase family